MKVLVLGSAGQVGAYLVEHLTAKGYEVTAWDVEDDPYCDLRLHHNLMLEKAINDTDFVFFLAFDVGGSRYLSKYQHTYDFIDNNVSIMYNTFLELNCSGKPFVFASSQMSNMSYSPYGVMKAVGELYTKALDGRIVKFWNVYGIEHDPKKYHVITDFILKARDQGVIDMMTDGEEEREFLYAEDCCNALEQVMLNYDQFTPETELHITSFKSTKIIDIARIIADRFDARIEPAQQKDMVQMNKKNEPDKTILKYWQPKTSIEDGIDKIIKAMNDQG